MLTVDFDRIPIAPGDRILDVGCGSGRHTCGVFCQPQTVAIGTDLSYRDLSEARRKLLFHQQMGHHGGGKWG